MNIMTDIASQDMARTLAEQTEILLAKMVAQGGAPVATIIGQAKVGLIRKLGSADDLQNALRLCTTDQREIR
jgi:hypothetical protein